MKKTLLTAALGLAVGLGAQAQQRYLNEIFPNVNVAVNESYGEGVYVFASNVEDGVLSGLPQTNNLRMDVYKPEGDVATDRMAVVVLHTGNFLPRYFNQSTTGSRKDSSVVTLCNKLAKRGFVAVAISYRLGWDPLNTDADVRRGTLLNAVYRGLTDVKTAVRFLKRSVAENQNPYGIDPNKIVLFGYGTGGYLASNYASLDRVEELQIEKFTNAQGDLYVDINTVGNIDGSGGNPAVNIYNHAGFSNNIMVAVNAGGALGDSTWLEAGEPPMISFHCPDDPFAPFESGIVIVPTTQEAVVEVSGSKYIIGKARQLGNNDLFEHPYSDPFSQAAYTACASGHPALGLNASAYEGLFPFRRPTIAPGRQEASPWDFWNDAAVTQTITGLNVLLPPQSQLSAPVILASSLNNNPDMSPTKGKAYIDSIVGYMCPRLVTAATVGITERDAVAANLSIFPNPANDVVNIKCLDGMRINGIELFGMNGQAIEKRMGLNTSLISLPVNGMVPGLYVARLYTDRGMTTQRISVQ